MQADKLKEKSENNELTETSIKEIIEPGYFPAKVKPLKLSGEFLSQHFNPEQSMEEIESIINQALEKYFSSQE